MGRLVMNEKMIGIYSSEWEKYLLYLNKNICYINILFLLLKVFLDEFQRSGTLSKISDDNT